MCAFACPPPRLVKDTHKGWALLEFTRPYYVASVGLCSANDGVQRDPASFDLVARDATGRWVAVAVVSSCPFTDRWEWVWYPTGPDMARVPVTAIRLVVHCVRRKGEHLQLGHLHVQGTPAA